MIVPVRPAHATRSAAGVQQRLSSWSRRRCRAAPVQDPALLAVVAGCWRQVLPLQQKAAAHQCGQRLSGRAALRVRPAAACARPSWISFSLASEMLCVAARGGGGRNTASSALCAAANCEIASRRTLDLCGSLSATSPTPGSCRAAAGLSARAITSLDGMMLCYHSG